MNRLLKIALVMALLLTAAVLRGPDGGTNRAQYVEARR